MNNPVEPIFKAQKPEVSYLNKGIKLISNKIEEYIVHKTQTERRKALFGHDPMMGMK